MGVFGGVWELGGEVVKVGEFFGKYNGWVLCPVLNEGMIYV